MPVYLMTTGDDSADEDQTAMQPRKDHEAVFESYRQQTIQWSIKSHGHRNSFICQEDLSLMMFVNGYLEVLATVDQDMKVHMLSHLQ